MRSKQMVDVILEATARVLSRDGYAAMNTNRVAAVAGVSVGSVYQYFPNKDSLVAALHERHAAQVHAVIEEVIDASRARSLRGRIDAMVHALLAAHRIDPELHRVLERELPFFDAPKDDSPADAGIYRRIRALLEQHRSEITLRNLELATWMTLQLMEALVHQAVIDPPRQFVADDIEGAIRDAVLGYLTC